ncbi:MAG: TonB-dependent receptor [Pseudomonadota bacterium]
MTRNTCVIGALMVAASTLSPAFAQQAGTAESSIEEVIVTVERREQTLQEYAGTAQAFSGEDLLRDGVGNELQNLANVVPGLSIANQEGNIEIYIRGVGSANNTELGDPAVAPHINGVYVPRPRGLGVQFYDVQRVEVNKGPQGTLRGRNSTGGTINIITNKAQLGELSANFRGEIGTFDQRALVGVVNAPIGERAAVRFAAFSEERESNYENVGLDTSLDPAGIEDEFAGRFSLHVEPIPNLSLDFIADFTTEGGTGYPGTNIFQANLAGFSVEDINPREIVNRAVQGELDSEQWGFTALLNYDFAWGSLEYTGSFRELDFAQTNAAGNIPLFPGRDISEAGFDYENFSNVYWQQTSDAVVQEIRLASSADSRLRWSLGGFYLDEDQTVGFLSANDNGLFFSGVEFTMPDVDVSSVAGYFDATFDVTDAFRVKGGLRYTVEDKRRFGIGGNWTLGLGSLDFNCCFTTRLGTPGFAPTFQGRPTFTAPTDNASAAQFLVDGATFGADDTLVQQLAGVADGSSPNGTCIDTPNTNRDGSQTCPDDGQHSFFVVGAPVQQVGSYEDEFLDFRLGMEFDVGEDNLLYAIVSTAHKSGGFNDNLGEIAPEFDPEKLTAYEIGSKNAFYFGDRRVIFNASAFYYDYEDQVFQSLIQFGGTGDDGGLSLLNENVADTRIFGAELFTSVPLGGGFSFDATALLLDAEAQDGELADVRGQDFGQSPSAVNIDLAGNTLPNVSDVTLIGRLQHAFDAFGGQLAWQVLANYRSDYFLTIFNEDDIVRPEGSNICDGSNDAVACGFEARQEGFVTLNAGVNYRSRNDRWILEVYGSNLLDVDASVKALVGNGNNLRFLNNPRQIGLRFTVNL